MDRQFDTRELNDTTSQMTTNKHYLLAQVIIWLTYLRWFDFMVLSARRLPRMLTDVQKADRAETSASLTLFNENPDKCISRFVTVDDTWLHHFDLKVKHKVSPGNISLLHLPDSLFVDGNSRGCREQDTSSRVIVIKCDDFQGIWKTTMM